MHQLQESRRAKVETPPSRAPGQQVRPGKPRAFRYALPATLLLVFAVDQATKAWAMSVLGAGRHVEIAGRYFQLRLVRNAGSAFGLFSSFPRVIFLLNLAIMVIVAVWAVRTPGADVPFGLVLGGGLGNLADRIFRPPGMGLGEVVDFLYLSFWPTFNFADSAIVIGVFWLILDGMREQGGDDAGKVRNPA